MPEDLSYLVSDLRPFTDYTFRVAASTIVGEGPATDITEKTREQGWTVTHLKVSFRRMEKVATFFCFLWFCFDPIDVFIPF